MGAAIRNLHVPLAADVYAALRREAARCGLPATQVAREAIERLLQARRREEIDRQLDEYISKVAGTTQDLDPVLERAALEEMRDFDRPKKRRRK